jgi:hypothetical protein
MVPRDCLGKIYRANLLDSAGNLTPDFHPVAPSLYRLS